jgi:hypothetical protein
MPVRKGSKKLGASPGLFSKDALGDDETRLARYSQLNAEEKARVRAKEKAVLEKAKSERERPLSSRIMDRYYKMGPSFVANPRAKEAAEDTSQRESRYQDAKREASKSDKDRNREVNGFPAKMYPVDRKIKLRKGGSVSASRRGDGIARKGKTRGKVC